MSFEAEVVRADLAGNVRDGAKVADADRPALQLFRPLDRRRDIDGLTQRVDETCHDDVVAALQIGFDDLLRTSERQGHLAALDGAHERRTRLDPRQLDVESLLVEEAALFGSPQRSHG